MSNVDFSSGIAYKFLLLIREGNLNHLEDLIARLRHMESSAYHGAINTPVSHYDLLLALEAVQHAILSTHEHTASDPIFPLQH